MLPTPSTSHVNYNRIYEPAEDSFLLIDTLSSSAETAHLRSHYAKLKNSPLVLEVGTGSGVILAFITAQAQYLFGRADVVTLGIDINHFASSATVETVGKATARSNSCENTPAVFADALVGDLVTPIRPGSVDLLIFNPPYVPSETIPSVSGFFQDGNADKTAEFERDSNLLYLSTDGGVDGMEVTDRLLEQVPHILSEHGIAYILLCAQNKPEDVMRRIPTWPGEWQVQKVGSSGNKAGWERLCVLRISSTAR